MFVFSCLKLVQPIYFPYVLFPVSSTSFAAQPSNSHVNTRPMVNSSKVGITKPEVYVAGLSLPLEPLTFQEARSSPDWCIAMTTEYQALL